MGTPRDGVSFDIDEIPFSTRGSWMNLSRVVGLHTRAEHIHLVSHQTGMHAVLRLEPQSGGKGVDAQVVASPAVLEWRAGSGVIRAVFDGPSTVRVTGADLGMRFSAGDSLTPFTGGFLFTDPLDGAIVLTSYETGRRYRFTVLSGHGEVVGDAALGEGDRSLVFADGEPWEVAIEEYETARPPYRGERTFAEVVRSAGDAFSEYARALAPDAGDGADSAAAPTPTSIATATKAAYVLWSATVRPSGFVGREAILMSKHWMDKVWSWDHCFNALALAASDPGAALDQFLLPFDHQDASGALPDSVTHSEVLYNFVKPPIHGWAFRQLEQRASRAFTTEELATVYRRLAAWTRFWLDFRRAPGHALPYYQHGNDSGWDNATTFDAARVIESPDLAAFLLLQLDELALLAERLGESGDPWAAEAVPIRSALFDRLWTGEDFVARAVQSQEASSASSLLNALPIVLGKTLTSAVADRLASIVETHLTEWGPATEPVGSPLYESDGYWRGPIWAPSTVLIEDGLRRAGHTEVADRISAAFRRACERSGFAENFDAVSGEGLRDRAYTWTASAYLLLHADATDRARNRPAPPGRPGVPQKPRDPQKEGISA